MWKSYKAFMKKSDRIQFYILYPACCMLFYALLLWRCAPGLRSGEIIDFFEIHSKRTEVNVFAIFLTIVPSVAYFLSDYCSLAELFGKKKENLYFLRRSCKGRQVLLDAVKMDLLLRLGGLALSFGGMVLVELLIGAIYQFSFRSLLTQGVFWLSGVVICFTVVTLVVTLIRLISGNLLIMLLCYFGIMLEGALSVLVAEYIIALPVLMVLGALLAAGNLALAKRRWKEGAKDEESVE